jgi:hypothetical protein
MKHSKGQIVHKNAYLKVAYVVSPIEIVSGLQ